MDAKRFLEEWQRMCDSHKDSCTSCLAVKYCQCYSYIPSSGDGVLDGSMSIDDLVSKIEQWSKKRPRKTRLDDFREKYPNAQVIEKGLPFILPRLLGYCQADRCRNCPHYEDWDIKDCWDAEVEGSKVG